MEQPAIVPKSFGCLPQKSLKLRVPSFRSSKSSSSLRSPSANRSSSPRSSPLTPRRRTRRDHREDELKQVFRHFDTDNDGKISAAELRGYFGSIGENMSHEEAQAVIDDLDTDGDNMIDFEDFMRLMKKDGENGGGEDDLKAVFGMFEFERGSGRITPKSLQRVLSKLGDTKSSDECADMIRAFDTDGKGELEYHEFHQMMMS